MSQRVHYHASSTSLWSVTTPPDRRLVDALESSLFFHPLPNEMQESRKLNRVFPAGLMLQSGRMVSMVKKINLKWVSHETLHDPLNRQAWLVHKPVKQNIPPTLILHNHTDL